MRQGNECTFRAFDGTELSYRHWPAASGRSVGALVLIDEGPERSGWTAHLIDEPGLDDFTFYEWDTRGAGPSSGPAGLRPNVAAWVRDVDDFVVHAAGHSGHRVEDVAVIAEGVGSVPVSAWLHDYAPRIRCAVLVSPAFEARLPVPFRRTADRVVVDAQAITVPVQLFVSGADLIAPQFFARLGGTTKEMHVAAGLDRDARGKLDRDEALLLVGNFIRARFTQPRAFVDLTCADRTGPTKEEADRLAAPLPPLSLRRLYWAAIRLSMRFAGMLSTGIRLGHETGFDSGSTLDYVYQNVARGRSFLGRFIDRRYLDSIGWRGIRQRKVHVEELIRQALRRLKDVGAQIHVFDIAAGHGRYVLEALDSADVRPTSILLRDYSDLNVRQGSALIQSKRLEAIARFEKGDAFDRASLSAVTPRPTLAVVSGLYELFPDNDLVARSLAGLADAVPAGGYLVYTGQPWHPQLELIARTLTSHRAGKAWVMRRRTQGEMDQLVERAGFRKLTQRIDEWGIFTVSLAVREGDAAASRGDLSSNAPSPAD